MVFRAGQRDPCTWDVARFSESVKFPKISQHPACMDHAILHGKPFSNPLLYNNYSKTRNLIGQYPCRMRQSCTGNLKVDIASHFTSLLRA